MLFELIRKLTCSFDKIEPFVPKSGKILDVGCGHGIFSRILAEKSKERKVLGIDPSRRKIDAAKRGNLGMPNLNFKKGYIEDVSGKNYDCISVIDVMYLLPTKEKVNMLKKCYQLLKKEGKLLLVINGKEPSWIFRVLQIQENFMVRILKFTHSDYKKIYFLEKEKYRLVLEKIGFEIEREEKIKSTLPYPHLLFVARRQ